MHDPTNPYASPQVDATEAAEAVDANGVEVFELYRSTTGLGGMLRTAFWLLLIESILGIAAGVWYLATSEASWGMEEISPAEWAEMAVGMAMAVTYLAAVVMFCKWKYRSYRNAQAFGAPQLRFSPGWAVGYYFVPIANLFNPYKAMKDIYNGTRDTHVEEPVNLIGSWWAAFIVMGIVDRFATRITLEAETLEGFQAATGVDIFASVVTIFATLLVIRLTKKIDSMQAERARALGWELPEEQPMFGVQ